MREKNKFKDTKIGKFLKNKAPNILDVVGDKSCIKLIEYFLHFFAKGLLSGQGKSTTIKPFTPTCLHFFKNLFSPY